MSKAATTLSQIEAAIDVGIRRLAWLQAEKDRLVGRKGKSGPPGPKGPVKSGIQKFRPRKLQLTEKLIVDALEGDPDDWSTQEILDETAMNKHTCVNAITQLVRDGHIVRVRQGFYRGRGRKAMSE